MLIVNISRGRTTRVLRPCGFIRVAIEAALVRAISHRTRAWLVRSLSRVMLCACRRALTEARWEMAIAASRKLRTRSGASGSTSEVEAVLRTPPSSPGRRDRGADMGNPGSGSSVRSRSDRGTPGDLGDRLGASPGRPQASPSALSARVRCALIPLTRQCGSRPDHVCASPTSRDRLIRVPYMLPAGTCHHREHGYLLPGA